VPFKAVFAVVAAGVTMSNLDAFVVNVALPRIEASYHAPLSSASWVLNAYAVIFASLLVPAGRLADRLGARHAYLLGIGVFTAASLACTLAPGVWWLVGFRVVQAAGAAMLIPASLGLLLAAAPPERRMMAVRGWAAISTPAAALGPALGGLLSQASWRWVFLINVPIGVAALLAGPGVLPRPPARDRAARLDLIGAVLLSLAIGAVALGVVEGSSWGWTSGRVIGALAGGVVLLILFVVQSSRHSSPMLPPDLLRIPSFFSASVVNLLFAVPFAAMLLSSVLWVQGNWHWSSLATGLAIVPGPLMVPLFALAVGPAMVRRIGGAGVAFVGCVIFAGGIAWWIGEVHLRSDYPVGLLPGVLLTGIGVGLTLPTLISVAVSAVPPQNFSTGSAVVTMARQVGTVLGVAVLVAILNTGHSANPVRAFDNGWWFTAAAAVLTAIACLVMGAVGSGKGGPEH
jgi:EmrB/QacA subfamily drug resistance transporter